MKRLALLLVIPIGLLAAGCTGTGYVETRGTARYSSQPSMVYIEPGVYVMEDYHQPVFYTDGYYWLYDDGYWYQSTYYTGGWSRVRVNYVPRSVRRIDRPRSYVRYRAPADRRRFDRPPAVRDHRSRTPARRNTRVPSDRSDHRSTPARRGTPDRRATPPRGRDHRPDRATPRGRDDRRPSRSTPPARGTDDRAGTRAPRGRHPGAAPPAARDQRGKAKSRPAPTRRNPDRGKDRSRRNHRD